MRILLVAILLLFGCSKKVVKKPVVLPVEDTKEVIVEEVVKEPRVQEDVNFDIDIPLIEDVVLFDLNSSEIRPEMALKLDNIINDLVEHEGLILTLKGGCCPLGEEFYNKRLGYRRAVAVQKYINSKIGNRALLSSYGEDELVSSNPNEYFLNRRCEIGVE